MTYNKNDRVKFNTNFTQLEQLQGQTGTVNLTGANDLVLVETDDTSYGVIWVHESQIELVTSQV